MVIRGAGPCFSAGYDLAQDRPSEPPWPMSPADGAWARHVLHGWFEMMDMATPIIAQVHGYCLAGGTELATACDLVYVAEDAEIGYPPVRLMSSPDMAWHPWMLGFRRAMEAMLTGDSMSGAEAVEAGFANRAFPAERLDDEVLAMAERVAKVPPDLQASTSASCTGPWRRWACATACGPPPTSTPSASTSARRGSTTSASPRASRRRSTPATPSSATTAPHGPRRPAAVPRPARCTAGCTAQTRTG